MVDRGRGDWVLFDFRVVRQEGSAGGARVLKTELASFIVPRGAHPTRLELVVESLHEGLDGPMTVDQEETRRAYGAAREAADARLAEMYREVVAEYGTKEAILPRRSRTWRSRGCARRSARLVRGGLIADVSSDSSRRLIRVAGLLLAGHGHAAPSRARRLRLPPSLRASFQARR